jgi:predicted RNase H-like HicB family nuclease
MSRDYVSFAERGKVVSSKSLEYYLGLDYPMELTHESDDGGSYWAAEIIDLPGCVSHGDTADEAVENLNQAKQLWIEDHLANGYMVPEPVEARGFSGRVLLRLPKSVHYRLSRDAAREGVSLNSHLVRLLVEASVTRAALDTLTVSVEEHRTRIVALENRLGEREPVTASAD